MTSQTAVITSYLQVMEATGFYRNGIPTSGVIPAASLRSNPQQLDKRIKYSAVINPEQLNATAIFELCGSPCIYFTQLQESDPEPQELARLHQLSWNHGLAPMLWVVTPTKVLLYNCYSQPTENDRNNPDRHLIEIFQQTETGLKQLNQYASRIQIESGEFWQWEKAKQIDRKQRVDAVLVKDLTDTEEILVEDKRLNRSVAQSLLIQSIFVAYLQDREILDFQLLQRQFGFNSFTEILENKSATEHLFSWIQRTFNGDLFSLSSEEINRVQLKHLEVIKNFIGGLQELKTGQLRLWRAYNFKVIPVELISAIYEKFIYAEDAKSAKANSTHYTPINLVDLVLSEVFKQLDGNAKVLDLACGSGVFLVDALRRLVVKRLASGEQNYRQLVRDTLYHQIYGVDIKQKAIQIAAFSLYLTALELDYELERNPGISEDLQFEKIIGKNLFIGDAFDEGAEFNTIEPFTHKQFSAIVGNPPWTKSEATKSASAYCNRKRPEMGYPKGYPTAYGTPPDQAFLWRIGDFANTRTQIGLILHGQRFFSNHPDAKEAKKELLKRFYPKIIINFSKLRREHIFPHSEAPAIVLIAEFEQARFKDKDSFYFVCPERSVEFRKHGIIEISSENIKKISVHAVAFDSDMLKIATWGSARDLSLIQRLRTCYEEIDKIADISPKSGLKVGNKSKRKHSPSYLYGKKFLDSGMMPKYKINPDELEYFDYPKVESPRDSNIYKSPLIIVAEKVEFTNIKAAFSSEDIVYTISYSGIRVNSEFKAHYINAVLNSSVTNYFLFMTASAWGIERNKVMTQDLLRLPIPTINPENLPLVEQIIHIEGELCNLNRHSSESDLKLKLDELVFRLYELDEIEQIIVEDKNQITIDLYMNREQSLAVRRVKPDELTQYATQLIGVIQPFLQTLNERKIVAEVIDVGKAPLQVVKFSIISVSSHLPIVKTIPGQQLEIVLKKIAEQLPQQIADHIYTRRDLRIYVGKDIYIVKPAKRIYWTRSAGLNDADTILSEYLRTSHASIG
ncbi:MAG: N-6 DNA methylase [Coleofasciculus sp. A1-SPW-01]|uniref:HsdM family class I SAM-dependent methyltransferase n=1 Tax=Coleofasciculus sp. A1-SPW-01 TaxID=3070819 RepID=UPI0032F7F7D6